MNRHVRWSLLLSALFFIFFLAVAPFVLADAYPPYWDNTDVPAPVHYDPVLWPDDDALPDDGGWRPYTREEDIINDQRTLDPSNGGTRPQNYVNVSSGCPDQSLPSIYWAYNSGNSVLFFRWRVEQIGNNYTDDRVYQSSSPWNSAQWTVMIDLDGDGFREFAFHIDGSTGSPSEPIDILRSIYSNTPSQSLEFVDDPNVHLLFHNPSSFVDRGTDYLMNFGNSLNPLPSWPGVSPWDYGSTRSWDISTSSCNEYFVDYQIPMDMLDASSVGGPTLTADTPFSMFFTTANSLNNPLQKDAVYDGDCLPQPDGCIPFGDLVTLNGGPIYHPVIDWITATDPTGTCNFELRTQARDAQICFCDSSLNNVDFYYYYDTNANGTADDGNSWVSLAAAPYSLVASVQSGDPASEWTATWDMTDMPKGQYLIGASATDTTAPPPVNTTWSYLLDADLPADTAAVDHWSNLSPIPGIQIATFLNDCGKEAYSAKAVTPPSNGFPGDTFEFTITVTNARQDTAVVISQIDDILPPGFSFDGGTAEGGTLAPSITGSPSDLDTGTITWTFSNPSIPAGGSGTLIFTANSSSVPGTYTNIAHAHSDLDAPDDILETNPVQVSLGTPRVTIDKSADQTIRTPGQALTYTLTYSNDSPVNITGVTINDDFPDGLVFVSASDGGTYDETIGDAIGDDDGTCEAGEACEINWTIGSLASLEGPLTVTFNATVENPYPETAPVELTNTATITFTAPVGGSASDTATVFIDTPRPELVISKSPDTTAVDPAVPDQVAYTITYQNIGDLGATGVAITDPTPAGFTYISSPGSSSEVEVVDGIGDDDGTCEANEPCNVTWSIGALAAGGSGTVTLTVEVVNPYTGSNPATNTATIDSNETSPVSASCDVAVIETGCSASNSTTYYMHDTTANIGVVTFLNGAASSSTLITVDDATVVGSGTSIVVNGTTSAVLPFLTLAADAKTTATITVTDATNVQVGNVIIVGGTQATVNNIVGTTLTLSGNVSGGPGDPIMSTVKLALGTAVTGSDNDPVYGVQRIANTTAPAGVTSTVITSPQADFSNPFAWFYQDPATSTPGTFWDPITVIYYAQKAGGNPTVTVEMFDYNPADGTKTSLGSATGGAGGGITEYSINLTPSGSPLAEGHRLLWLFSVNGNGASVDLHYDMLPDSPDTSATYDSRCDVCLAPIIMGLDKRVDKLQASPAEALVYTIDYSNAGQGGVTGLEIVDTLPDGVTYVSNTGGGTAAEVIGDGIGDDDGTCEALETCTVTWSLGALAGGGSGTVTINATVDSPLDDGIETLLNTAVLDTDQTDTLTDTATTEVLRPSLIIEKSVDKTRLVPGDTATFTLTVLNTGNGTASSIVVLDDITPMDETWFSYVAGSIGPSTANVTPDASGLPVLRWDIATLAPGESESLTFQMIVDNTGLVPSGDNTRTNYATATEAATGGYQSNTVTVTITSAANLSITKTSVPAAGPLDPGDTIQYTVTISSIGGSTAEDVLVEDSIPASTGYQAGSLIFEGVSKTDIVDGDEAYWNASADKVVFNIGDLAVGASRTMKFTVAVDDPLPNGTTTITNTATVSSSNTANKQATATITAAAAPAFTLRKTAPDVVAYPLTRLDGASQINTPIAGQTTITVDSAIYIAVGDTLYINAAVPGTGTVVSISGNDIVIDSVITAADNDEVRPTFDFVITYKNTGNATSTNTQLDDILASGPPDLVYISASPAPSADPGVGNNGTVTWDLGTLYPGDEGSVKVRVRPTGTGTFLNTGTVTSTEVPAPGTDSNETTTIVGGVSLEKRTTVTPVTNDADGTQTTYIITLTNNMPAAANDIEVTDNFHAGFSYNGTTAINGGTCTSNPDAVAPSEVIGTDTNNYTCVKNHTAAAANRPITGADWSEYWLKKGSAGVAWVGGSSYTADNSSTWRDCDIAAGATLTIEFVADIANTVAAGTYNNGVSAVSSDSSVFILPFDELETDADDVTVIVPGDVQVKKTVTINSEPCRVGCSISYTITVTNVGSNDITSLIVEDTLPVQVDFASLGAASQGSASYDGISRKVSWIVAVEPGSADDIVPGGTATLVVNATVNTIAFITNCASRVDPTTPDDTNESNDTGCAFLQPTLASVSDFRAFVDNGRTVVLWETSAEINTAGFYLFRIDGESGAYVQVNRKILPGLLTAPQGGTYSLIDKKAPTSGTVAYMLMEVDMKNTTIPHGPFTINLEDDGSAEAADLSSIIDPELLLDTPKASCSQGKGNLPNHQFTKYIARDGTLVITGAGDDAPEAFSGYNSKPKGVSSTRKKRLAMYNKEKKAAAQGQSRKRSGAMAKIAVKADGLYSLDMSQIASLLGISPKQAGRLINGNRLALMNRGRPVATIPGENGSGIFFFGQAHQGTYTGDNIYWLSQGIGTEMDEAPGVSPEPADSPGTFLEKLHVEEDIFSAHTIFDDPDADYWFWKDLFAGDPARDTKSFIIDAPGAADGAFSANLTVNCLGVNDTPAENDHHLQVSVNGILVNDTVWDGLGPYPIAIPISQGILNDGSNTVEVKALKDSGVPLSIIYIDSFDLSYHRRYEAVDDRLLLSADGNPVVTAGGFSTPDLFVFEVTDPLKPVMQTAVTIDYMDGGYRASFAASSPDARYLVLSAGAVTTDADSWADEPSDLSSKKNQADFLVITTGELKSAARELANYRGSQGLATMVVLMEDIMDEFNFGIFSPAAVRDFLAHAYSVWKKPPRYVVLAGDGTFDYRDRYGFGGNLVPAILVPTPFGLTASDNHFADVDGDSVPEMAIGRLPAMTTGELSGMIQKITLYENTSGGEWEKRVLLVADNPDGGGDYHDDSDLLAALVPDEYSVTPVYLHDGDIIAARQLLKDELERGAYLLNYFGHSTLYSMAHEGLLTIGDMPALLYAPELPVVTAMTCYMGNFSYPWSDSLSEHLMLNSSGGAAAVFSPTGLSFNFQARTLDSDLYRSIFADGEKVFGDAVVRALKKFRADGGEPYMTDIYTITGDPALIMR